MNEFESFPKGKDRKLIIELNKDDRDSFKIDGARKILNDGHYSWTDSPLEDLYSVSSFSYSFKKILPEKYRRGIKINLKKYIEETLENKKGHAVGVEFGGIGSRLFMGFTKNFFKKSIGVSIVDHRNPRELEFFNKNDKKINHTFIEGDIFSLDTYKILNDKLEGEKVDFIIERMAKGLEFVPVEPYKVGQILQIWYKLLNENGLMIVQTPVVFDNLLEAWVEKIKTEFSDVIEIEFARGHNDVSTYCSSFRLRKLPNAPTELPVLDHRTISNTSKNM